MNIFNYQSHGGQNHQPSCDKMGQTLCLISLDWFQWAVFPKDNWSPPEKMFIGLCMSLKDKYTPKAAWIGGNVKKKTGGCKSLSGPLDLVTA